MVSLCILHIISFSKCICFKFHYFLKQERGNIQGNSKAKGGLKAQDE